MQRSVGRHRRPGRRWRIAFGLGAGSRYLDQLARSSSGTHRRGEAMGKRDPRVDGYIAKSGDFAKPILKHFRDLVHAAIPDVEETMKWSAPHFEYEGVLAGMAAFKQHCNFILWKAPLVIGGKGNAEGGPLRNITKLSDLPSDRTISKWLAASAKLNEQRVRIPRAAKPKRP